MNISDKLKDPELSKEAEAEIIGAFVRRQKREALGKRWSEKLMLEHDVKRRHLRDRDEKKPRLRRRQLWILPAVAAAILLLILLLPQLQSSSASRTEVVAAILLETEIDVLRGGEASDFAFLQSTFAQQYNTRNYTAAIRTGKALVASPEAQPQDSLHLGLAYLNADELAAADALFGALLDKMRTEATFYLALTKIERGQDARATELLESIQPATDGVAWFERAQRVLSAD